ncbi:hypothetical protein KP509_16G075600 [Ceratopteris richardii]|uniref:Uncharacterized protein n=1 Tax=Ceratopteris richardii TaxID=49495 RepID=A0A8T2T014_CERRI|nr:hypothetical protein KP509_16G075600 [Ceratopteris richardii]
MANAGARKKLLQAIQRSFNKEYKAHQKVDLETLMPKLHKLRRVHQHKVAPHFFEDRVKLTLKTQRKVLLDLEKAINEWTFGREITTIKALISIAVNVKRDKIEQKKKKTLEEIVSVSRQFR